ncbi:MAG: 1-acyl-sn-glycerol-3-phosphate acyltransferase [Actinomycetota bacterium]|nr:1-acyl-sn-glycerol-3-phosphate acyltransferase [Actinomycetota bacterium]
MIYRIRWWLAGVFARIYTLVLFKGVEVEGSASHDGPRLIVANHFGGLVDAIVVVRALGGLPYIVAKSTLFKRLPMRLGLRALGVVPVYRRRDHSDTAKNVSSFHEVAKMLAKGRTVLIFPEGTVTDTQELQTVRTGAARMALSAIEAGTHNLAIIPVGITYEDKVSSRSRVLVEVGDRITSDEIRELAGSEEPQESNRVLVKQVTALVAERLGAVSPEFGSLVRERTLMLAASIHLRTRMTKVFADPTMADLRTVAQELADSIDIQDENRLAATGRYQLALTAGGLEDDQVQPMPKMTDLARIALVKGMIVVVMAPFALLGLTANIVAILLVMGVGAFVKEPVSKGTARVITGIVVFPLSWIALIAVSDPNVAWLAFVLAIVGLVFLVLAIAQLVDLFEALSGWWAVRNHLALLPDLSKLRSKADAELSAILGEAGAPSTQL